MKLSLETWNPKITIERVLRKTIAVDAKTSFVFEGSVSPRSHTAIVTVLLGTEEVKVLATASTALGAGLEGRDGVSESWVVSRH